MTDDTIFPTTGTIVVALADRDADLVTEAGITVSTRSYSNPAALPEGRTRFTVTSPPGWLHLEDDGAVYRLSMGDAPEVEVRDEPTPPMDMGDHMAALDLIAGG